MFNKLTLITVAGLLLVFMLPGCIIRRHGHFEKQLSRAAAAEKAPLESVPTSRKLGWNAKSTLADSVLDSWSQKDFGNWAKEGKGDAPRVLLAKLVAGKDIPATNQEIMKLLPRGVTGTKWALNKTGDYDFTLTVLTTVLWLLGDKPDYLFPETKNHLLHVLLTAQGNKFTYATKHTLGLIPETENHVLMTEGSRYLKNRWLMLHGGADKFNDNSTNGMEAKLLSYLARMEALGLYEFNSLPYTGYTITALLNLEAFGSEKMKTGARRVLDYMNWCYALGSYQLRHYPPMRRRYEKAKYQNLTTDYHSVFMKTWLSYSAVQNFSRGLDVGMPHALMAACLPYRPADDVVSTIFEKGRGYYVKMGHGKSSCPEIYSAGKHFLLSAGGANRGKMSIILPRPTCLFLADSAEKLSSVIHLAGPGKDFMEWNNTGVYKNFACAAGPVVVPAGFKPAATSGNWAVYALKNGVTAAVFSSATFGLIAVFEDVNAKSLLNELMEANPEAGKLPQEFNFPKGETIRYDVNAPHHKWVITEVGNRKMDRNFEKWPLIQNADNTRIN